MQPQHFHAVLQSSGNGVQHIRRSDEEHLRQIVFHVQVVIDEHEILFRIEHFQQRRRRIAAEVRRHLVDFVEHEDRILGAGLFHHLDDLARQSANVGPAVATDFRFVPNSPQGEADKLPTCSPGN